VSRRPSGARSAIIGAVVVMATACAPVQPATPRGAVADLRDARGRPVGKATLSEVAGAVRVVVEVQGLPPGEKAVHVHEIGRCEPPAFTSAGGHF
jgi:Cu-Zn family superoxide dismutase